MTEVRAPNFSVERFVHGRLNTRAEKKKCPKKTKIYLFVEPAKKKKERAKNALHFNGAYCFCLRHLSHSLAAAPFFALALDAFFRATLILRPIQKCKHKSY